MSRQPQALPTNAGEWGQPQALPLPTGRTVLVRPAISLISLAVGAKLIPNPLSDAVVRIIMAQEDLFSGEPQQEQADPIVRFREYRADVLAIVAYYVVSPRIVAEREPDYAAGEIAATDLHDTEVWTIYNAALGGPRALASFRNAHDATAAGSEGAALQHDAQPAAQD